MKKLILGSLLAFSVIACSSKNETNSNNPITKGLTSGKIEKTLYTSDKEDSTTTSANYQFYNEENSPLEKVVNKWIYDYVKEIAFDPIVVSNVPSKLSTEYFEKALENFDRNYKVEKESDDDLEMLSYLDMNIEINEKISNNFVQVTATCGVFTGGAHPYVMDDYLVVTKKDGEIITWEKLLKDSVAFNKVAEKYFRKVEELGPNDTYEDYFFESKKFERSQSFLFEKDKLIMLYKPYEAREWARGYINVEIPLSEIKNYITILP